MKTKHVTSVERYQAASQTLVRHRKVSGGDLNSLASLYNPLQILLANFW